MSVFGIEQHIAVPEPTGGELEMMLILLGGYLSVLMYSDVAATTAAAVAAGGFASS